jgi:hypothetical protein
MLFRASMQAFNFTATMARDLCAFLGFWLCSSPPTHCLPSFPTQTYHSFFVSHRFPSHAALEVRALKKIDKGVKMVKRVRGLYEEHEESDRVLSPFKLCTNPNPQYRAVVEIERECRFKEVGSGIIG